MPTKSHSFTNEQGNKIDLTVTQDERGVTVEATGPNIHMEHTWTPKEVLLIRLIFHDLLGPIEFEKY